MTLSLLEPRTCWRCGGSGNWYLERRWPIWVVCNTCYETGSVPVVLVDELRHFGWVLRGRQMKNCHMYVPNPLWIGELHRVADLIGMKRSWFQADKKIPHYDLTPNRRAAAVRAGAVEVDFVTTVDVMHIYRQFNKRRRQWGA